MDQWDTTSFEIHQDDGCAGMEILPNGSLEINVYVRRFKGDEHSDDAMIVISDPDRVAEILSGIQAWIEQL